MGTNSGEETKQEKKRKERKTLTLTGPLMEGVDPYWGHSLTRLRLPVLLRFPDPDCTATKT